MEGEFGRANMSFIQRSLFHRLKLEVKPILPLWHYPQGSLPMEETDWFLSQVTAQSGDIPRPYPCISWSCIKFIHNFYDWNLFPQKKEIWQKAKAVP